MDFVAKFFAFKGQATDTPQSIVAHEARDEWGHRHLKLTDPMSASGEPPNATDAPFHKPGRLTEDDSEVVNRAPRYALRLAVWYSSADGLALGETVDISASGMLVDFEHFLDVWLTGELTTQVHGHTLNLIARVVRLEGHRAALTFRIRGDEDRAAIAELMVAATEQGQIVPPVL